MNPQDTSVDQSIAQVVRLKVTLDYSQPQIMRRIEVPLTSTLYSLHEVIQAVMLFESYHLFQFDVGPRGHETHYGIPDPDGFLEVIDAKHATLDQLIDAKIKNFTYTYDFGDDWRHTITVEAVTSADPARVYPRFIDGARRAPPEDVGGQPGFENFLSVMADPKHPEYADIKRWYGRAFNPDDIAAPKITARMAKLNRRKPPTKPKSAKSKRQIN
jgi:hypothetical protein